MADGISVKVGNVALQVDQEGIWSLNFPRRFNVYYSQKNSYLNELCRLHGSDKGGESDQAPYPWPAHSYADFMERAFGQFRLHVSAVFECGIGSNNPAVPSNMTATGRPGASLRVWRDYFPHADIFGIDVDAAALVQEHRIRSFLCDQTKAEDLSRLWRAIGDIRFDLMIDDGLHTFEAGVTLYESSRSMLSRVGVYIIEDVNAACLIKYYNYFADKNVTVDFVNLYRSGLVLGDNSLVVIREGL